MEKRPAHILPLIVLSQFAGTSLWFAGNAILPELQRQLNIEGNATGNITSVVQFGFIAGTLVFAILSIADRLSSSWVFFASSLLAALANISIIWLAKDMMTVLVLRFITGFFLAGIYPVGMKIAADWFDAGLGKTLGLLVGALVLGTAFPYLLKSNFYALPAREVLWFTSVFAVVGGFLILLFVGNGPYQKKGTGFHPSIIVNVFRSADFRAAAFGYFGHMWELYALWAFVSDIFDMYRGSMHVELNLPLCSFIFIAVGSLGCAFGGYISQKIGSTRVAFIALLCSGICCLLSAFVFYLPPILFILIMIVWGFTVTADSPQFSTLIAQISRPEHKGTALTIVTCIGFAITIASIQLLNHIILKTLNPQLAFVMLAPGPIIGLLFLSRLMKKKR